MAARITPAQDKRVSITNSGVITAVRYAPLTLVTLDTTAQVMAPMDAVNLSFVVSTPASGPGSSALVVAVSGQVSTDSTVVGALGVALAGDPTHPFDSAQINMVVEPSGSGSPNSNVTWNFLCTRLTPASTHTYEIVYASQVAPSGFSTGVFGFDIQNVDVSNFGADAGSPFIIVVYAA